MKQILALKLLDMIWILDCDIVIDPLCTQFDGTLFGMKRINSGEPSIYSEILSGE
jgi:hypothetical protein